MDIMAGQRKRRGCCWKLAREIKKLLETAGMFAIFQAGQSGQDGEVDLPGQGDGWSQPMWNRGLSF